MKIIQIKIPDKPVYVCSNIIIAGTRKELIQLHSQLESSLFTFSGDPIDGQNFITITLQED